MGLPDLLRHFESDRPTDATSDSREVTSGCAFIAVRGAGHDGHAFIDKAVTAGARLVVGEDPPAKHASALGKVPYFQVSDSREALAALSARLQGDPTHGMVVVGVTGTSGKTTSTYLLESILWAAGHRVGVVGTVNFRYGDKIYPSTHTTPGARELQRLLHEMRGDGCTAVVMEVSSHALKQRRADFIAFDAVIFTNLTREHLDFHPDMEDYFRSKALLFTRAMEESARAGKRPVTAVSVDDEWGRRLVAELKGGGSHARVSTFGHQPGADFSTQALRVDYAGIKGEVEGVKIQSALTGAFNAQNLLGAVAAARGLGIEPEAISRGISALPVVPGRLERVAVAGNPVHVLVDYAHKPDALEKVLLTLRELKAGGRLIAVMGCGGDRDRGKRPVMGRLAAELADLLFVTSDNPRTEDPAAIIQEILSGIPQDASPRITVEADRRRAIFAAIAAARPGDLVLIAGKGHEDYQIIGAQKVHFDDREVAAEALRQAIQS